MNEEWFDPEKQLPPFDSEQPLELWWAGGNVIGYFDDGLFAHGSFWIPAKVAYGLGFANEGEEYKKLITPSKWRYPQRIPMNCPYCDVDSGGNHENDCPCRVFNPNVTVNKNAEIPIVVPDPPYGEYSQRIKIKKYITIVKQNRIELERTVTMLLNEGWECVGGFGVHIGNNGIAWHSQAVQHNDYDFNAQSLLREKQEKQDAYRDVYW